MNDRIKKLAEQAGFGFDGNLIVADEPIYFVTEIELEKFAELIVLECCKEARDEVQSIMDWDKADQVVTRIKEHFGVAE